MCPLAINRTLPLLSRIYSATNVAYLRLLPKLLHRHGKVMSIYYDFILDDTFFNQKYFFVSVICESVSKNV